MFKTGGCLIRHARYFVLQLADAHLTQRLFAQIIRAHRATRVAPDLIDLLEDSKGVREVAAELLAVGGSLIRAAPDGSPIG